MKDKVSEAEMIRRLQEIAADEDKYFPGVLGNPATLAGRWGLPLSGTYRKAKANGPSTRRRRTDKPGNKQKMFYQGMAVPVLSGPAPLEAENSSSGNDEVPDLTLSEVKRAFETYVEQNVLEETATQVWRHVDRRIREVNKQGRAEVARIRHALGELKSTLPANEEFFLNRFELSAIVNTLDREVFGK
jgi:hypothetical protein